MAIDLKNIQSKQNEPNLNSKKKLDSNWLNLDIQFSTGINDKKKGLFYAELSILLLAKINIKTALEIIEEGKAKDKERHQIHLLNEDVINGSTLSEAMRNSGLFSDYEYYSLKIGEESGNVTQVLKDLAKYYKKKIEQKRKIINTFSYPVIVLFVAIAAVVFMLNFIVPMFKDVFIRFGGELPALTQLILDFSEWISAYGSIILFSLLTIGLFLFLQRKKRWFRNLSSQFILKIPFIKDLVMKIYIARFSHSMHLLSQAKNPLLNSIQLVQKMLGFYPLENALLQIEKDILFGYSLHESMEKHDIFNKKITSLIKVGEEVNQLELIFEQITDQYEQETAYQTEIIGNLMEPFLIIFIGGFVAIILVAMYLPLFQLGSSSF